MTEIARNRYRMHLQYATLLAPLGEVYLIRLNGPASCGKLRVLCAWIPAL